MMMTFYKKIQLRRFSVRVPARRWIGRSLGNFRSLLSVVLSFAGVRFFLRGFVRKPRRRVEDSLRRRGTEPVHVHLMFVGKPICHESFHFV